MDARVRAMEREHNGRAWLAWTTAALGRVKRLPKLGTLLVRRREPSRRQGTREFWSRLQAVAVAAGARMRKRDSV